MTLSRRWWTFALVSLALFMSMLDNLVVTTALPAIQYALHARVADLEWIVNAYTLTFTILMIPAAALGDRFGRRRVLLIGVLLFTIGSTFSALAPNANALILARALQGVGGACITPLTLTMLTVAFPPTQRTMIIGLWSGVSGLGLAAGPLVGGAIVNGWAWNAIFWVNVPIGLILLVLGVIHLQESYGDRQLRFDLAGNILIGVGLFGLIFGLIWGNAAGWGSAQTVGALTLGTFFSVAFVLWERRVHEPMIDLKLFAMRDFSITNTVGFLMHFGIFGSIFFIMQFVQDVQGASPLTAGLEAMPWTATIMVAAPLASMLSVRFGARLIIIIGMIAQAVALFWIALLASATVPYVYLLPAFLLGGIGMGFSFAPLSDIVVSVVPEKQQGQASSVYTTMRELGGVFGVAVLGAVFQHNVVIPITPGQFLGGFRAALSVGASVVACGALLALFLPRSTLPLATIAHPEEENERQQPDLSLKK